MRPSYKERLLSKGNKAPEMQERRVADSLGGKRVRGSGASMYSKGDVRGISASVGNGEEIRFLTECKTTVHNSISVKWEWLRKITMEAMAAQCEPALSIEIRGENDPNVDVDWIAIPARVFRKLQGGGE